MKKMIPLGLSGLCASMKMYQHQPGNSVCLFYTSEGEAGLLYMAKEEVELLYTPKEASLASLG